MSINSVEKVQRCNIKTDGMYSIFYIVPRPYADNRCKYSYSCPIRCYEKF